MADGTKIEWTDATWNPITGCSVVSAGCKHCYAMRLAGTRMRHHPSRAGLTIDTKAGPVWNGEVRFNEQWLDQPLRWKRPREIFVCAHGDLFHADVPELWIDRVFGVMSHAGHHRFQVLTKRSDRMRDYLTELLGCGEHGLGHVDGAPEPWPFANVIVGASIEDRASLWRLDALRNTPARHRFLSIEPLLEELGRIDLTAIHQVIVGGESGIGARPMHPDWVRSLRDQCAAAGVPFLFKQWGEWAPISEIDTDAMDDRLYAPRPVRYPEAIRRCLVETCVLQRSGRRFDRDCWSRTYGEDVAARDFAYASGLGAMEMMRVGKKSAGRLLDGVQHDGRPS